MPKSICLIRKTLPDLIMIYGTRNASIAYKFIFTWLEIVYDLLERDIQ